MDPLISPPYRLADMYGADPDNFSQALQKEAYELVKPGKKYSRNNIVPDLSRDMISQIHRKASIDFVDSWYGSEVLDKVSSDAKLHNQRIREAHTYYNPETGKIQKPKEKRTYFNPETGKVERPKERRSGYNPSTKKVENIYHLQQKYNPLSGKLDLFTAFHDDNEINAIKSRWKNHVSRNNARNNLDPDALASLRASFISTLPGYTDSSTGLSDAFNTVTLAGPSNVHFQEEIRPEDAWSGVQERREYISDLVALKELKDTPNMETYQTAYQRVQHLLLESKQNPGRLNALERDLRTRPDLLSELMNVKSMTIRDRGRIYPFIRQVQPGIDTGHRYINEDGARRRLLENEVPEALTSSVLQSDDFGRFVFAARTMDNKYWVLPDTNR